MLHLVQILSMSSLVSVKLYLVIFIIEYIFLASSDGYAKLWNVKTGNMEREYAGHQKAVIGLAFRDAII